MKRYQIDPDMVGPRKVAEKRELDVRTAGCREILGGPLRSADHAERSQLVVDFSSECDTK